MFKKPFGKKEVQAASKPIEQEANEWGAHLFSLEDDTELVRAVSGREWVRRYHQMLESETVTRAFAVAAQLLLSQTEFRIQCNEEDTNSEYEEQAKQMFLDWGSGDFRKFIRDFVSTILYGYSTFEFVSRRNGSLYELDALVLHPQVYQSAQYDNGQLTGFSSSVTDEVLPLERCIYTVGLGSFDNSAYGQSVLKAAYFHFRNKCRVLRQESIAIRNNVVGVPVFRYDDVGSVDSVKNRLNQAKQQLIDFMRNRSAVSLFALPSSPHTNPDGTLTNHLRQSIELVTGGGVKGYDLSAIIQREETAIARALLADCLVTVGQDSGSYAMAKDKSSMFKLMIEGLASMLCHEFNHQIIKPFWAINGMPMEYLPELTYDSVDLSLDGMANYLQALTGAGVLLNDHDTEAYLREYGGLPPMSHDAMMEPMPTMPTLGDAEAQAEAITDDATND